VADNRKTPFCDVATVFINGRAVEISKTQSRVATTLRKKRGGSPGRSALGFATSSSEPVFSAWKVRPGKERMAGATDFIFGYFKIDLDAVERAHRHKGTST
jgi:hypothetical protein